MSCVAHCWFPPSHTKERKDVPCNIEYGTPKIKIRLCQSGQVETFLTLESLFATFLQCRSKSLSLSEPWDLFKFSSKTKAWRNCQKMARISLIFWYKCISKFKLYENLQHFAELYNLLTFILLVPNSYHNLRNSHLNCSSVFEKRSTRSIRIKYFMAICVKRQKNWFLMYILPTGKAIVWNCMYDFANVLTLPLSEACLTVWWDHLGEFWKYPTVYCKKLRAYHFSVGLLVPKMNR